MQKTLRKAFIIGLSILIALLLNYLLPYEDKVNKGLALLVFIAILWLTEIVHITVTALLIPILAILLGLEQTKPALQAFANPTIFLFFGGFVIATALSVQKLDRYIANRVISLARGNFVVAILLLFFRNSLIVNGYK